MRSRISACCPGRDRLKASTSYTAGRAEVKASRMAALIGASPALFRRHLMPLRHGALGVFDSTNRPITAWPGERRWITCSGLIRNAPDPFTARLSCRYGAAIDNTSRADLPINRCAPGDVKPDSRSRQYLLDKIFRAGLKGRASNWQYGSLGTSWW